jgi:hypothetical protein
MDNLKEYRGLMSLATDEARAGKEMWREATLHDTPNPRMWYKTAAVRLSKAADLYQKASQLFSKSSVRYKEAHRLFRSSVQDASTMCDRAGL